MKHFWRPLWVVFALVALILVVRLFLVPKGFGVHERGYMYGWYNKDNEAVIQADVVNHQGREYCKDCHEDQYNKHGSSPHKIIQCENCHGAAGEHPEKPEKLGIDRNRDQCLRCHARLPYAQSGRSKIKGVDPKTHNTDIECVSCHNPHQPSLEGLK